MFSLNGISRFVFVTDTEGQDTFYCPVDTLDNHIIFLNGTLFNQYTISGNIIKTNYKLSQGAKLSVIKF